MSEQEQKKNRKPRSEKPDWKKWNADGDKKLEGENRPST